MYDQSVKWLKYIFPLHLSKSALKGPKVLKVPRLPKSAQTDQRCPELPNLKNSIGNFFGTPCIVVLQGGKLDIEFGFVLVFFHWPSMQP